MTYQPRSGARQLPLLGPAIVGAVMLVRSDTVDRPEPVFDDTTVPDLSRFSVVLNLPQPQLGEMPRARFAPVAKLKSVAAGQASHPQSPDADAAGESRFTPLSLPMPQPLSALAVSEPVVGVSQIASLPAPALQVPQQDAAPLVAPSPSQTGPPVTDSGLAKSAGIVGMPTLTEPSEGALARPVDTIAGSGSTQGTDQFVQIAAPPSLGGGDARDAVPGDAPVPVVAAAAPARPPSATVPPSAAPAVLPAPQLAVALPEPATGVEPAQQLAVAMPGPVPGASPQAAASVLPVKPQAETASAYPASEAPFPPGPEPTFSYDDELILQIETTDPKMSDTIIAYGTRSGVYLPVGGLTRFLDLSIAISDDGHFASGWFLSENRTLSINLREGKMVLSGVETTLARGQAIAFDGELYLRAEDFAKILPLRLTTDLRSQLVRIETLEEFPYAQRLAREKARERLDSRKGASQADAWPREETPYRAFSLPMTDVELRAASDSSLGERLEGDLRVAGDLAFMTARAYLSGTTMDGLTGARIELGRRDPDAQLLGPLRATEFQLGDVATQSLPLGLRGVGGRGAAITNAPIDSASLFDSIDLRGELPEGYEVELYRNDILIDSTRTPVNGQYEFLQVPVDFGNNVFRFVFFGPQGQRYEEVRRISVGDGRRKPGELVYGFGIAQKDINLLGVRDPSDSRPVDYGAWRATGSLEYGISRALTAQLAGSWFETGFGKSSWLASAGLRTGLGGTAIRADLGFQKGGGKSAQLGVGGQLFGASYTLTHAEYSGNFIDEVRAFSSDFLDRASEFNVNTTVSLGGDESPIYLPISARLKRLEFANGRIQSEATVRASTRFSGLVASKTFEYINTRSPLGFSRESLVGSFDLATLSGSRTQYRGSLVYAVAPKLELRSAAVQVDHAFGPDTLASATLGHTFTSDETRVGLSATQRFRNFTLSFNADYAVPTKNYSAALRLGFGFGRNPLTGRFFLDRPGLANGGAIAVRAYHDRNADNRFDDGDLVLPEVKFGISGRPATTGPDGIVMVGRLGDGTRTNYKVDLESLPDIALFPTSAGKSFVPRAGRVHISDFPVVELSEIEGTARFVSEGRDKPVSGVFLELVGADGKVVRTARTEGDGFYLFEQVKPGNYTIRIAPDQAQRIGISLSGESAVAIAPRADIVRRDLAIARQ